MQQKYKCHTELRVHWVCSPGALLSECEDVYLSVELFGVTQRTKLMIPVFPLLFNEAFIFEKTLSTTLSKVNIYNQFKDIPFGCELRQLNASGCDKLLAYYDSDAFSILLKPNRIFDPTGRRSREVTLKKTGGIFNYHISSCGNPSFYNPTVQPIQRERSTFMLQTKSIAENRHASVPSMKPTDLNTFCSCSNDPRSTQGLTHPVRDEEDDRAKQPVGRIFESSNRAIEETALSNHSGVQCVTESREVEQTNHLKDTGEKQWNAYRQYEVPKLTCLMHEMWHLFYPFKDSNCPWNQPPVRQCAYPESLWINMNGELSADFKQSVRQVVQDAPEYVDRGTQPKEIICRMRPCMPIQETQVKEEQVFDIIHISTSNNAKLDCIHPPILYKVTIERPRNSALATVCALSSLLNNYELNMQQRISVGQEHSLPCTCQLGRKIGDLSSTCNTTLTPTPQIDLTSSGRTHTLLSTHGSLLTSTPKSLQLPVPHQLALERLYDSSNRQSFALTLPDKPSSDSVTSSSCDAKHSEVRQTIKDSIHCPKRAFEEKSSPASESTSIVKPKSSLFSKLASVSGTLTVPERDGSIAKLSPDHTSETYADGEVTRTLEKATQTSSVLASTNRQTQSTNTSRKKSLVTASGCEERLSVTNAEPTRSDADIQTGNVDDQRCKLVEMVSSDSSDVKAFPDVSTSPTYTGCHRIRVSEPQKYSTLPTGNTSIPRGPQLRASIKTTPVPKASASTVRKHFRASIPMSESVKSLDIQNSSIKNVDPRKFASDCTTLQMYAFSSLSPEGLQDFETLEHDSLIDNVGSTIRYVDSKSSKDFSKLLNPMVTGQTNKDASLPRNSNSTNLPDANVKFQFVDPLCQTQSNQSVDTVIPDRRSSQDSRDSSAMYDSNHQSKTGGCANRSPAKRHLTSMKAHSEKKNKFPPTSNENQVSSSISTDPLSNRWSSHTQSTRTSRGTQSEDILLSVINIEVQPIEHHGLSKENDEYGTSRSSAKAEADKHPMMVGEFISTSSKSSVTELEVTDPVNETTQLPDTGIQRKSAASISSEDSGEVALIIGPSSKSNASPPTNLRTIKSEQCNRLRLDESDVRDHLLKIDTSKITGSITDTIKCINPEQTTSYYPEVDETVPNSARKQSDEQKLASRTNLNTKYVKKAHLQQEQSESFTTTPSNERSCNGTRALHIHLPQVNRLPSSTGRFQQASQTVPYTRPPLTGSNSTVQTTSSGQYKVSNCDLPENDVNQCSTFPSCGLIHEKERHPRPHRRRRHQAATRNRQPQIVLNIIPSSSLHHTENKVDNELDKNTTQSVTDETVSVNDQSISQSHIQVTESQSTPSHICPVHGCGVATVVPGRSQFRAALANQAQAAVRQLRGRVRARRRQQQPKEQEQQQTPIIRLIMTPEQYRHMVEVHHLEDNLHTQSECCQHPGSGSHNKLIRRVQSEVVTIVRRKLSNSRARRLSTGKSSGTTRPNSSTNSTMAQQRQSIKCTNTRARSFTVSYTAKPCSAHRKPASNKKDALITEGPQNSTRNKISVLQVAQKLAESQRSLANGLSSTDEPAALGDSSAPMQKCSLRATLLQRLSTHKLNFRPGLA